ncbi:hypothetical protein AX16_004486 [Volvariella volvacea WC 439]|nr:hypothetical protein AX16_004486 [Volvariella volvacea WC 439]
MYARQCFLQQHNRKFVFCLIVTQTKFQLYQFDRCGYIYSTRYNIHEDAALFVRMILGVSWGREMVGFDTSVFWEGKERYIRVKVPDTMVRVSGSHGEGNTASSKSKPSKRITRSTSNKGKTQASQKRVERTFKIRNNAPSFLRRSICGRGTTCWLVEDNDQVYLVKDAWRYVNRDPETIWLDILGENGCRGVAQMITYEHGSLISELRRMSSDDFADDFYDRQWSRIMLYAYGPDIGRFQNLRQLLCALRDAIAGHKASWDVGVLHRDVSSNNILLGPEDAGPGDRGILIDFDLAISTSRQDSLAAVDFRTGTRRFQALRPLKDPQYILPSDVHPSADDIVAAFTQQGLHGTDNTKVEDQDIQPAHCHLDDLESFYYVLAWICLTYNSPGEKKATEDLPLFIRDWDSLERKTAFSSKHEFLTASFPEKYLSEFFRPIRNFLRAIHSLTYTFFKERRFEATPNRPIAALYPAQDVISAYTKVLQLYDFTIRALELLEADARHGNEPETEAHANTEDHHTPPPESPKSSSPDVSTPSLTVGASESAAAPSRKRRTGFSGDEEAIEIVEGFDGERRKSKRLRSSSLVPLPRPDAAQLTHNRNKSA